MSAPANAREGPLRIVICTAAVGCGHTRAALAIRKALRHAIARSGGSCIVDVIEALDYAPAWFVRGYRDAYLAAIARVPALAGWLYTMSDRPQKGPGIGGRIERLGLRKFERHPALATADVVVTTHFLCARLLSEMRARGDLSAPLVVGVTDLHPHGIWLVEHADRLMVASDEAKEAAVAGGMPPERVVVTGIPIDLAFGSYPDRATARRRMGLPEERPIALVCGGGLGLGGMEKTVQALLSRGREVHVVAVCGKNEELKNRLKPFERAPAPGEPSCDVLGFTTQMPGYMGAADVLVGKPGGLTTAEAAASGLPMVLLRPIPGQEERNAAALVRAGAALLRPDPADAGVAAAELLANPDRTREMREAARKMGRRTAATAAATTILELLGEKIGRKGPGSNANVPASPRIRRGRTRMSA